MGVQKRSTRTLIGVLCALWLWMFIYPMNELGLLVNPDSFIPIFIVMGVLSSIRSKWVHLVSATIVSFASVAVYFRLSGDSFIRRMESLLKADGAAFGAVIHGHPLIEPLQTQLFIGVLFIVYWLILFASTRRRLWLFYNALGLVVLCIVDVNTTVHPEMAMLLNTIVCLCVLAIGRFAGLGERRHETVTDRLVAPVLTVIVGICSIGLMLPKQNFLWASPFKWSVGNSTGTQSKQVIGFQTDDSWLGGSFEMNYDPVLTVTESFPSYMRGQALSTYTGKGWVNQGADSSTLTLIQGVIPTTLNPYYSHLTERTDTEDVNVVSDSLRTNVVFGAYSIQDVWQYEEGGKQTLQFLNNDTGTITGSNTFNGDSYRVASVVMTSPLPQLKNLGTFTVDTEQMYPKWIGPFLEIPSNLPGRVRDLARKVAAGGATELDIVTRIQDYLKRNYHYDTQNIPVPTGQTDYVDQFLFETKRGYCNNFSTAMAVMLRAVNIPTRWVTGYAPGEQDLTYQGSKERYIIRNSDAHSWVEVYFPHYGWVPFDPTPGFSMAFAPSESLGQTGPGKSVSPSGHGTGQHSSGGTRISNPQRRVHLPGETGSSMPTLSSPSSHGSLVKYAVWILIGILILAAGLILGFRRDIQVLRYYNSWKRAEEVSALHRAIGLIYRYARKSDTKVSTLRGLHEVAKAGGLDDKEYREFIQTTEGAWYGKQSVGTEQMENLRKTWLKWIRNLVKRPR